MKEILEDLKKELGDQHSVFKEKQAGVVALLRPNQDELFDVLYMIRAEDPKDHWSGQVGFPGGKRDAEDPNILHTAKREFHEEMGLNLDETDVEYLGALNSIQGRRAGVLMDFTIHPHVFYTKGATPFSPDPAEVGGYFWVSAKHILNPQNIQNYSMAVEGMEVHLPGLSFPQDKILWGLTYMMTRDLFLRLQKNSQLLDLHNELSGGSFLSHLHFYP